MNTLLIISANLLLLTANAFSQEIETDRPDQTEYSSVLPQMTLQVETGILRESDVNTTTLYVPTTLLRLGVFSNMELRIIAGEYFIAKTKDSAKGSREKGFSPFSLGTKVFICNEKGGLPQTSLLFHLNHDQRNLSFSNVSCDFRFSMSHTLSSKIDLGYNLGGDWDRHKNSITWIYTLTAAFSISSKLGVFIEIFGGIEKHQLFLSNFQ